MVIRTKIITILTVAASINAPFVFADATINIDTNQEQATLVVKDNQVLIQSNLLQGDAVFNTKNQTLTLIDHEKQTISPVDQKRVSELAGQIDGAVSMVQNQLENMPTEQRAQIETFMGGLGLSLPKKQKAPATVSMIKTTSKSHLGMTCDESKVMEAQQQIGTVCLSRGNSTKLSDQDYNTLLQTQTFLFKLAKQAGKLSKGVMPQLPSFGDLQLNSLVIQGQQSGDQQSNFTITNVNTDNVNSAITIPTHYRVEDITKLIL